MTDADGEIAAFVRHLNHADPRDATNSKTVFVHNETAGADTDRRWLTIVILYDIITARAAMSQVECGLAVMSRSWVQVHVGSKYFVHNQAS